MAKIFVSYSHHLEDDTKADAWDALLKACGADLRVSAPDWLEARNNIAVSRRRPATPPRDIAKDHRYRQILT